MTRLRSFFNLRTRLILLVLLALLPALGIMLYTAAETRQREAEQIEAEALRRLRSPDVGRHGTIPHEAQDGVSRWPGRPGSQLADAGSRTLNRARKASAAGRSAGRRDTDLPTAWVRDHAGRRRVSCSALGRLRKRALDEQECA